jgi:hypothetical protein
MTQGGAEAPSVGVPGGGGGMVACLPVGRDKRPRRARMGALQTE